MEEDNSWVRIANIAFYSYESSHGRYIFDEDFFGDSPFFLDIPEGKTEQLKYDLEATRNIFIKIYKLESGRFEANFTMWDYNVGVYGNTVEDVLHNTRVVFEYYKETRLNGRV